MPVAKLIENVKVPPLALAVVVSILTIGFFAGVTVTKMQSADEINKIQNEHAMKMHEHALEMQKLRHDFSIDEVSGLRADVFREDAHLQKQIDELKKKLEEVKK